MARKLKVTLDVDSKTGVASVNKVTKSVTKLEKTSKKASKAISDSFKRVAVAFTVATTAIAALGVKSIALASDLEETQGKFDVVFRGMAKTAEKWSDTLQESYAMAETESKKYLSSIQDLLVPTGLARDAAGELSNKFVKMAADLGSFNNRETVDVIRDIQSALQGGSETMAKYGINVKAAKVEQEILNQKWVKSKKDITDAHKAQAIYNIIMRDGADAIGDMERTSGSYANQLKKFKANINDLTTAVGVELLPKMTELVTEINKWIKQNDSLIKQKIPEYIDKIRDSVMNLFELYTMMPSDALEFGIIGYILLGKKGAAVGIALSAIKDYAIDAYDAIKFIQEGLMTFDETTGSLEKFYLALERARMATRVVSSFNEGSGIDGDGVATLNIEKDFSVDEDPNVKLQQEITDAYNEELKRRENLHKLSLQKYSENVRTFREADAESMKKYNEYKLELDQQYADERQAIIDQINMMISSGMTDALFDWIDGTKSASEAFKDFASDFLKQIAKMIIQQAILNALQGEDGKGGIVGAIMGMFGGMKAGGGPVAGNKSYIVGEEGPELFTPGTSGAITPNNKLGVGGVTVVNNIQIEASGDSQQDELLARRTAIAIETKIKEVIGQQKRYGGLLFQGA